MPDPTPRQRAERLTDALIRNMSDRRGFDFGTCDEEVQQSWRAEWERDLTAELTDAVNLALDRAADAVFEARGPILDAVTMVHRQVVLREVSAHILSLKESTT